MSLTSYRAAPPRDTELWEIMPASSDMRKGFYWKYWKWRNRLSKSMKVLGVSSRRRRDACV